MSTDLLSQGDNMENLTYNRTEKSLTGEDVTIYTYTRYIQIEGTWYYCAFERHIMGTLVSNYMVSSAVDND